MCKLKFMFDHGAMSCIWGCEDEGLLPVDIYPISIELMGRLESLCQEYHSILNWDDPASGYVWTQEQVEDFHTRAQQAYDEYVSEVGEKCEVENWINVSLGIKD